MAQHRQVFCRFPQPVTLNLCLQLFSALMILFHPVSDFLILLHVYLAFPTCTNGYESSGHTGAEPERRDSPTTITRGPEISGIPNGTVDAISGVWGSSCDDINSPPCVAFCRTRDTVCQDAVRSAAGTCNRMWKSYDNVQYGSRSPGTGWSISTTVVGATGGVSTYTVEVWTSFSTANVSFVKGITTITPVYALGSPVPTISVTNWGPPHLSTIKLLTASTPSCKFMSFTTLDPSDCKSHPCTTSHHPDCGLCTVYGGTVDLYFWPPSAASSPRTPQATFAASHQPWSTVLEGTTLYSPTVYISFQTLYASNDCNRVGNGYTNTLMAMKPEDVSTQYHWGGMVAQSGANHYGPLNYGDLTGLPPASDYEMQPSCIMFGCLTIYSRSWHPTLMVPSKVRSIDPAWASCALGLEGL